MFGIVVVGRDGDTRRTVAVCWSATCAHLLDTVRAVLGWLWPLWDGRRRTFADLLTRTEVHVVASRGRRPPAPGAPRSPAAGSSDRGRGRRAGLYGVYRHDSAGGAGP